MIWYKALFSFQGRLNRQGFWIGIGINFVAIFIIANFGIDLTAFSWLSVAPLLLSLYSLMAVIIKRLHDRNRSSKACAILVVPILCHLTSHFTQESSMNWLLGMMMPILISTILILEWGAFAGYSQSNQYGSKGLSIKFI